jgi:hypothetical protein
MTTKQVADKKPKAWREGRYYYCLTHDTHQVTDYQTIYEGDPNLWEGRKCDWCKAVLT